MFGLCDSLGLRMHTDGSRGVTDQPPEGTPKTQHLSHALLLTIHKRK